METKKYIIEIPDNTAWIQLVKVSDKDGHVCFDFKDPEDLTPYTEPNLDAVKKEVHDKCMSKAEDLAYKLYSPKIDEAYQRGLNDAWEAARTLWDTPNRKEIFGHTTFNTVLTTLTAQETIEKIQQYEQNEQESITAEDVMRQYLDTFCKGRICKGCPLNTPDFNFICGRGYHFITSNPISDEEVRRAYAEVCKR